MKYNNEMINSLNNLFREINKGVVSEKIINNTVRKYKCIFKVLDDTYSGMIKFHITDIIILKTEIHVKN